MPSNRPHHAIQPTEIRVPYDLLKFANISQSTAPAIVRKILPFFLPLTQSPLISKDFSALRKKNHLQKHLTFGVAY
jgi:hypothetical protein